MQNKQCVGYDTTCIKKVEKEYFYTFACMGLSYQEMANSGCLCEGNGMMRT